MMTFIGDIAQGLLSLVIVLILIIVPLVMATRNMPTNQGLLFSACSIAAIIIYFTYRLWSDCFPCGKYESNTDSELVSAGGGDYFEVTPSSDGEYSALYTGHCWESRPTRKNPRFGHYISFKVAAAMENITGDGFSLSINNSQLPDCAKARLLYKSQATSILKVTRNNQIRNYFESNYDPNTWMKHVGSWRRKQS